MFTYLYSNRKTWFCGHTIVWYHCNLFHHYHLHNLFLHHSATDQECSYHQGGIEIHFHYNQQENESLNFLMRKREAEGGKIGEKLRFYLLVVFISHFFLSSGIITVLERIHFYFRWLIGINLSSIL